MKSGEKFSVDALKEWLKQHGVSNEKFMTILMKEEKNDP